MITKLSAVILNVGLSLLFLLTVSSQLQAQDNCGISASLAQGYTTTLSEVIANANGTHTITLIVENNGCTGCKKLNRFSVQAAPGTFSNVVVEVLSGEFTYANIDLGPNLGGDPFQGFRINNTNGMGNGAAASFAVTYTLTGGLQSQQTLAKAGSSLLYATFSIADFQAVLDCPEDEEEEQDIFPYYNLLEVQKIYDLIGYELTSLYQTYMADGTYISNDIFQIVGENVLISVRTTDGSFQDALNLLLTPNYGLTEVTGDEASGVFTGLFPIENLLSLNLLYDLIIEVSPVFPGLGNVGIVTSQGDIAIRANLARNGFQVNGTGIKIGVLSDSYNTILGDPAGDDIIKGDLPGVGNPDFTTPVDVLKDYPYGTRSDEGRAMLQIVHDVAPGAELAFRTGFLGAVDFAQGIRELQLAGCDVIVDDITYISEPFFRDGIVAEAVDFVTAQGVSYFSAAGNFGVRSWEGSFSPASTPSGIVGEAHNFAGTGGNDIFQNISLTQGSYTVVLQWDDGTPGNVTNSDFDIYLANENGNTLFGFNRVNTGGAPLEVLPFTVAAETTTSNFLIVRESGSGPAALKYIVFRGDITINEYGVPEASTLVGQANSGGAIAVGAVLYSNTPAFGVDQPTVASFSSRGGTPVNGVVRNKPDICGPNGVNTTVNLGGVNIDGDEFPNFFGTSAAAPHAAGAAALVLQAREKYYGSGITPDVLKGILQSTAIDMYTPGYDAASGYGFIQADAALATLANPAPFVEGISYDTTLVPGDEEILLTIFGQYLNEDSEVWFDGAPVLTGSTLIGGTAITALIPTFTSLYPEIQVYNPPMEGTNGLDGGLSNPLYFNTKETILVTIDNKSKKYGLSFPEFTASYELASPEGSVDLETAGLSEEERNRIYAIELTTIANSLSNVGLWAIVPNSADPLSPSGNAEAIDPVSISLLDNYNFVFVTGFLEITPLDLNITPRDTVLVYNDTITGFSFDYNFYSETLNSLLPADSLALLSALATSHSADLVNVVGTVRGTALVNEFGGPILDATALVNSSLLISGNLVQSRGTALVNGELIDPGALANAISPLSTTSVQIRGTALVNAFNLVRGTALVNTLDTLGNIVNTIPLVNSNTIVNNTALMNATTINADSNTDAIVILGEEDIAIFSGDSIGNVEIKSINLITGNTVGTHLIIPGAFLTNNYNVTYGLGNITILPDTADILIDPASLNQDYDGNPKPVFATVIPEDLELSITYNGASDPPVNAGSYEVVVSVLDTNYVGTSTATLVVNPMTATISTGVYVINRGTALPVFEASFEGFQNENDISLVTDLTFTINPSYTTSSPAGIYEIIPSATAPNYHFTSVNGTLYVNPSGPRTKQIKPIFICSEALAAPDENGFEYIAYFTYTNQNEAAVYVPIGPDNAITGAAHDNSQQPALFLSGGGELTVPFDGSSITWQVTSNKNNGSKGAIPANSSNAQCNKSNAGDTKPETAQQEAEVLVFPNPTSGKVFLQYPGSKEPGTAITVYNSYGQRCKINTAKTEANVLEIDLSGESPGMYLIRIERESSVQVSKVIIH